MSLIAGCYLMTFTPKGAAGAAGETSVSPGTSLPHCFVGTLRVEDRKRTAALWADRLPGRNRGRGERGPGYAASGDLYAFGSWTEAGSACDPKLTLNPIAAPLPKPDCIPLFPRQNYRYFVEVLQIGPEKGVSLDVRFHRYDPETQTLAVGEIFHVDATDIGSDCLAGKVIRQGIVFGELRLRWVGEPLRRCVLQVVAVQPAQGPAIRYPEGGGDPKRSDRDAAPGWERLFADVGWDVRVEFESRKALPGGPPDGRWAPLDLSRFSAEVRRDRLARAGGGDPWLATLLCVEDFEPGMRFRGIMFDTGAADLNERPREAAAVAALQVVDGEPGTVSRESQAARVLLQDADGGLRYFRTAIHEVGHMFNLAHSYRDESLMNTTDMLVGMDEGGPARKFTEAVAWWFNAEDESWLRHAPDIAVRPGGIPRVNVRRQVGSSRAVPVSSARNKPGLVVEARPVLPAFPLGAPVRVDYVLRNTGIATRVPLDISLRSGYLNGRVVGPDRRVRFFRSLLRCCDSAAPGGGLILLGAGATVETGMTLLRGVSGPLFPALGNYRVEFDLSWDDSGVLQRVEAGCQVVVSDSDRGIVMAREDKTAAEQLLDDPQIMMAVVQGLADTASWKGTLRRALESKVLRRHYLFTALRCLSMSVAREGLEAVLARFDSAAAEPPAPSAQSPRKLTLGPAEMVLTGRELAQVQEVLPGASLSDSGVVVSDAAALALLDGLESIQTTLRTRQRR